MKAYIINGDSAYRSLFTRIGCAITNNLSEANLAVFTGGADVSPHLYGQEMHPRTFNDTLRDEQERKLFNECKERNIPMVGICRGGQFLNVMNGGAMFQHVSKHAGPDHWITDARTGETVWVTSTHHQMFKPAPEAVLVAFSTLRGDREWVEEGIIKREISETDYEVVFYPQTRALCFQPHPEYTGDQYLGMERYFQSLIAEFLM